MFPQEAADLEVLDKLNPVRDAGYQAEHHEQCLSGTRESILGDIMRWAKNAQDQPVFWLNGLAGTGKSTIAQTFSEMTNNHGIHGASFFCSRDYLDRKVLKNIFPTLAYQLACRYPRFRDHLVKVIKRDPSAAHNSLISQLKDLLVDPLSATSISCVVVIDALDECVDDQPASAILSVLGRLVSQIPLVKFFITGRPEPRIRSGFRLPLLEPFTQIFLLHEVDQTSVGGDIRLYLTEKLTAVAKRRSGLDLPVAWPSDEDLAVLVKKSSGLFIFASTVARFIGSEHHEPRERLRLIISKADDTSHEGASGIDSLYSQVLRGAFIDIEEESVFVDLKRILSAVVLALNPLSQDGLAQLLNIDSAVIYTRLQHLHSVILVPAGRSKEIRVFHKSFPDFLQDRGRCPDHRFHIDSPTRHGDMVLSCLDLVEKLGVNPCGLPPFVMNQDVPNRPQLLRDKLGSGLRYACRYWSTHLLSSSSSEKHSKWLIAPTSLFFNRAVFPWMEVMSLEGNLEDVIHSMNHLLDWLGKVSGTRYNQYPRHRSLTISNWKVGITDGPLLDLATDCLRFTLHFFRPIQMSAQHIYHTALPLSPETSIIRSWFLESHSSWEEDWTTRQVSSSSIPATWGPTLRTIKADSGCFTHVIAAGQRIVAVCEDDTVNVYDGVTGVLKFLLNAPRQVTKVESSPDGSVLFFAHQSACEITVWDTQTGGLIYTLSTDFEISDIAVSLKGKYLATRSCDDTFLFWEVESRCRGSHPLGQPVVCVCWLEPEDQVALALERAVVILEVTTGRTLRTIPVGPGVRRFAFSAGQRQLAILTTRIVDEIVVTGIQTGSVLVSSPPLMGVCCFTFSGDGDRIICATITGDLRYSNTSAHSFTWSHPKSLGTIHSMGLLWSGHLVANFGKSIQLLELEYTQSPSADLDPEVARVCQLDNKVFYASSKDHVYLLDMETMKTLTTYHPKLDERGIWFRPRFICASIDRDIAVRCFQKRHGSFALKLHTITRTVHKWEKSLSQPVVLGALSPDGEWLVIVSGSEGPAGGKDWELELSVRRVSDGENLASSFTFKGRQPGNIAFTSKIRFYIDDHRVFSAPPSDEDEDGSEGEDHHFRKTFSLRALRSDRKIKEVSRKEILPTYPYALDKNLEWVVDTKSRSRVCWLPPCYISGVENGHFFVGSSIVMAGQDGIVRKLTFRNPSSDSL